MYKSLERIRSADAVTPTGIPVPPVAMRRNIELEVFNVRLLIALDKLLRKKRRYQGDLSASINDALLAVNLKTVKLVTLQSKTKQTARETQVVILRRLRKRIQQIAEERGCSMNQLVNSGLLAYYGKKERRKLEGSSKAARGSSMAAYDKMSTAERQQLLTALGSLSGLQPGPAGELPDGTHYEYDPDLKTTLEVAPSGERFPVTLVAGRFQRDVQQTLQHKAAR
jgi:hypothetical protein